VVDKMQKRECAAGSADRQVESKVSVSITVLKSKVQRENQKKENNPLLGRMPQKPSQRTQKN
jgi:hypothetical protein